MWNYYRPQTKFAKVMFLHVSVILSMGGSAPFHAGIHTPQPLPETDTPLSRTRSRYPHRTRGRYPPPMTRGRYPPPMTRGRYPPPMTRGRYPPSAVHAGRYGEQAVGTYPTGMQSCLNNSSVSFYSTFKLLRQFLRDTENRLSYVTARNSFFARGYSSNFQFHPYQELQRFNCFWTHYVSNAK